MKLKRGELLVDFLWDSRLMFGLSCMSHLGQVRVVRHTSSHLYEASRDHTGGCGGEEAPPLGLCRRRDLRNQRGYQEWGSRQRQGQDASTASASTDGGGNQGSV